MRSGDIQAAMEEGAAEVALRIDALTFELVRIPLGEFEMGSPDGEDGHRPEESPVRRVRIARPFYLGRFPVTRRQYVMLMGENPARFRGGELPMDQMTPARATALCEEIERRTGVRVSHPTEAQWEYACRAGTSTRFHTGETEADLDRAGWYDGNSGGTAHAVGLKEPNAFGLYDMHGNVLELCVHLGCDAPTSVDSPRGATPPRIALRGGSYAHGSEHARSAARLVDNATFGGAGIRLTVDPGAAVGNPRSAWASLLLPTEL
jgi:formylglycine-generating enzyme required for sulfatase activity